MSAPNSLNRDPWADVINQLDDPSYDAELHGKLNQSIEALSKIEIETDANYCRWLTEIRDVIQENAHHGDEPLHVLYPGSATHTDVGDIFGAENVLHVDPVERDMEVLKDHGYRSLTSTVEAYAAQNPTARYDVIISHNSGTLTNEVLDLLNPDGFVVANNHHGSAAQLLTNPDFRVVAGVVPQYVSPDAMMLAAENLDLSSGIDQERDKDMLLLFQKHQ